MIHLSVLSRTYIRVTVANRHRLVSDPPLTSETVEFAFTERPETGDWHVGGWETVGANSYARILVGPGAVVLTEGMRPVLLRVTDNPERPVLRAGYIIVY